MKKMFEIQSKIMMVMINLLKRNIISTETTNKTVKILDNNSQEIKSNLSTALSTLRDVE